MVQVQSSLAQAYGCCDVEHESLRHEVDLTRTARTLWFYGHTKYDIPPFQYILNLARAWLPNGDPTNSTQAIEEFYWFYLGKIVKKEDRPTLQLAVLSLPLSTIRDSHLLWRKLRHKTDRPSTHGCGARWSKPYLSFPSLLGYPLTRGPSFREGPKCFEARNAQPITTFPLSSN